VRDYVVTGKLTAGHARTLVGHADAQNLANHIVKQSLSVRDAEKLAKRGILVKSINSPKKPAIDKDTDTIQIEGELSAALGMKVSIDHVAGADGGRLSVNYKNLEQLDDLLRVLSGG
jgi:ParB family chromosome partitioning protein